MMKLSRLCLLVLVLYGLFVPCVGSQNEAKTILVTYYDRTISRAPIATLAGSYRRSNAYTSSTWSRNIAAKLAREFQLTIQQEWPISELGVQCVVYLIPDDRSVDEVLESLGNNKLVESAQRMGVFNLHTATPGDLKPNHRLKTSPQGLRLENVHQSTTGKGVVIALIDTGVDSEHPDLKGQIVSTHNFITDLSRQFTGDYHGTAVAGVIAARADNNLGSVGVAPNVQIVALKACWPHKQGGYQASCHSLSLAMAINQAIKIGVDIINLSLSGPPDPLVRQLIKQAITRNITVVAADHQINQAGGQSFPASMDGVIAALHLQAQHDVRFSRHPESIAVASTDRLTTLPGGGYGLVSGCSIAATQVSGIVALLLEINPDLTPNEIQTLLETAKQRQNTDGTKEIDVPELISKLRNARFG
jgi:subtilisin family serine protease